MAGLTLQGEDIHGCSTTAGDVVNCSVLVLPLKLLFQRILNEKKAQAQKEVS